MLFCSDKKSQQNAQVITTLIDPILSRLYLSKAASFLGLPNKEKDMAYKTVFLLSISRNSADTLYGAADAVDIWNN